MKTSSCILLLATLLLCQPLYAHSDHQHGPITESDAQTLALDVVDNLSSRDAGLGFGQLAKTWASIPIENVTIAKKGKDYYIVSVLNVREKNTLYILISEAGEVYDANFTGEFEGFK